MLFTQNILFQVILIVQIPAALARNRKVYDNPALQNKEKIMAGEWDIHLIPLLDHRYQINTCIAQSGQTVPKTFCFF